MACKAAITELGAPGEPRKDRTPTVRATRLLEVVRAEQLLDEAAATGFETLIATEPAYAERTLRTIAADGRRKRGEWLRGSGKVKSGEVVDGWQEHDAAEALIAHAGLVDYTADDYVRALAAITEVAEATDCSPREAAAAIAQQTQPGPTPAVVLANAVQAASLIAFAAREADAAEGV